MAELQEVVTESEYFLWLRYRDKYGPLNPVRMYDRGHALVSTMIGNSHGKRLKPDDFLPYGKEEEEFNPDSDIQKLIALGGVKIGKRR